MREFNEDIEPAETAEARMIRLAGRKRREKRRNQEPRHGRFAGGLLAAAVTIGVTAQLLVAFSPLAGAEESPIEEEEALVEPTVPDEPVKDFFVPYPAGENAISYDEQSEDAKARLDKAALWAETGNGHAVQTRYSRLGRQVATQSRAKRAAQLAGTQCFDDLGVE